MVEGLSAATNASVLELWEQTEKVPADSVFLHEIGQVRDELAAYKAEIALGGGIFVTELVGREPHPLLRRCGGCRRQLMSLLQRLTRRSSVPSAEQPPQTRLERFLAQRTEV